MRINLIGAFVRNAPFGTEIAFLKGLRQLGHDVTTIDPSSEKQEWNYDADVTLVFKWLEAPADWENFRRCTGKRVVYQPDDMRFPHIKKMMSEMRDLCDYALTFDATGAHIAMNVFGYRYAKKLVVTADNELYRPLPNAVKDIDFCFVGSMGGGGSHASRERMCGLIAREFPTKRLSFHTGISWSDIVPLYNRSKVVLNHATDVGQPFGSGYGYQCRHFEAGMTGACVLSNHVLDEPVPLLGSVVTYHDEESLLNQAHMLLDTGSWQQHGTSLFREICADHMPHHRAVEMIEFFREIGVDA